MTISESIATYLLSYVGLTALVGTRIWPERSEQDPPDKYVVYHIEIHEPDPLLVGPAPMLEAVLETFSISQDYDSAHAIAEQIRLALSYFKGTMGGGLNVEGVGFEETVGGYNPDTDRFEAASRFTLQYTPA